MQKKRSVKKTEAGTQAKKSGVAGRKSGGLPPQAHALVLQTMAEAVSCTDLRGVIRFTNPAFDRIFGYQSGELVGKSLALVNALASKENAALVAGILRSVGNGETWKGELLNRRKDGSLVHTRCRVTGMARAGEIWALWVQEDVTEHKRAEEALRAQTERLLIGQRAAGLIVVDWDIIKDEFSWSDSAERLRGPLPPGGKYPLYVAQVHPEDRAQFLQKRAEAIKTLRGRTEQYRIVRTDGRVIWVETEQVVFPGADGKAARMVIALHDVTERKLAEDSLHRLNEELEARVEERTHSLAAAKEEAERASHAKSDFLASMSHELRTPLNTILGFTDVLKTDLESKLDNRQTEIFGLVQKAGWHLLNLINQVLDLENVESGALEVSIDRVELAATLTECVDFMRPQAEERQVTINLDRDSCAGLAVSADRTRLRQTLLNLLSNAVKYNVAQGRVDVACSLSARGRVRISVKDSGPGLSAEQQAQLYQPFNRLGREGSFHGGAGIGLMLTRRLVELMDGRIGVDSAPGAGSTFWLEFLRQPIGPPRDARRSPRVDADRPTVPGLRTALYVDDNPDCITLVEHILGRDKSLRLLTAETGELGLELARAQQPDLIILDIQLPGMDGYEVLRRLREDEITREIPTIAFSADALPEHVRRGKAAGFDNYLPKPIQASAFVDAVHRALKEREG